MRLYFMRFALALMFALTVSACDQKHPQNQAQTQSESQQDGATKFDTEQAAQEHCPNDTVVWVNTTSGVYHMQGQRWYGNTAQGDYMCQQDADAEGDRETRNGQ